MSRSHGACPHLQQLYYHAVFAVSSPSSHGANGERRVAARIPRMRKCLRVHVFLPVGVVSLSVSCACHISPESSLENESALCDGTDGERARGRRPRRPRTNAARCQKRAGAPIRMVIFSRVSTRVNHIKLVETKTSEHSPVTQAQAAPRLPSARGASAGSEVERVAWRSVAILRLPVPASWAGSIGSGARAENAQSSGHRACGEW